jgi:protein-tyrosine phosphatase
VNDVFWIAEKAGTPRLAIVMRPRGGEWLHDELLRLKNAGIRTVVSMLEHWEADYLGLAEDQKLAEQIGLIFISFPIPDRSTPADRLDFRRFISELAEKARDGETVGVHCRGCIGRSTIAIACTLIHLGWKADDSLREIEIARGCLVPDTEQQREWILRYEAQP